jgi:hypothetical protein
MLRWWTFYTGIHRFSFQPFVAAGRHNYKLLSDAAAKT